MKNVSVLVAIGVAQTGATARFLAVSEGAKEDKESWTAFLRDLKERGLQGVQLFVSDKCLGLVENLAEFYPEATWQRCVVHFYRNVFTAVPNGKVKEVAAMLKAVHAQEDAQAAREKAAQVVEKLKAMKLARAAEIVAAGVEETLSYYAMPSEHWRSIKTNNPLERLMREILVMNTRGGRLPRWQVGLDAGGRPTPICRRDSMGHEALPADEPAGRSGSHRLTACSGPPWGPEQINLNRTTFLSASYDRKCEKLWTLPIPTRCRLFPKNGVVGNYVSPSRSANAADIEISGSGFWADYRQSGSIALKCPDCRPSGSRESTGQSTFFHTCRTR